MVLYLALLFGMLLGMKAFVTNHAIYGEHIVPLKRTIALTIMTAVLPLASGYLFGIPNPLFHTLFYALGFFGIIQVFNGLFRWALAKGKEQATKQDGP